MKNIFIIGVFLLVASCKVVPQNQQITVASGGGFTNLWHQYTLQADGQLIHKVSNVDSSMVLKTISKSKTRHFFKQIEALKLGEHPQNEPGNMSYYVQFSERKKFSHKVQWGDSKMPADSIKTFYDSFMELVKK